MKRRDLILGAGALGLAAPIASYKSAAMTKRQPIPLRPSAPHKLASKTPPFVRH